MPPSTFALVEGILEALHCTLKYDRERKIISKLRDSCFPQYTLYHCLTYNELRNIGIFLYKQKIDSSAIIHFTVFIKPVDTQASRDWIPRSKWSRLISRSPLKAADCLASSAFPKENSNDICSSLDWNPPSDPQAIFQPIKNVLSYGFSTKRCNGGYMVKVYPCGQSQHSGTMPTEINVLNYKYSGYEKSAKNKGNVHPSDPQVNEELEEVEDEYTMIDIQIARNSNVLRLFLQSPNRVPLESHMVFNELQEIYGKSGAIVYQMLIGNFDSMREVVVKRLRMRGIELQLLKIRSMKRLTCQLEVVLPPQRAKYKVIDIRTAIHVNKIAGPIFYNPSCLAIIGDIPSVFKEYTKLRQSCAGIEEPLSRIIQMLRSNARFEVTYPMAAALTVCAMIARQLSIGGCYQFEQSKSLKIAQRIGISDENSGWKTRVLQTIALSLSDKKHKHPSQFLSGLYSKMTIHDSFRLIQLCGLLIKTLNQVSVSGIKNSSSKCIRINSVRCY